MRSPIILEFPITIISNPIPGSILIPSFGPSAMEEEAPASGIHFFQFISN